MSEISKERYVELLKMFKFISLKKESYEYLDGIITETRVCIDSVYCKLTINHVTPKYFYSET